MSTVPTHAASWEDLEARLARSLRGLPEDAYLIVEQAGAPAAGSMYFVQFAREEQGVLAEAVGNSYLHGRRKLDAAKRAQMTALGWLVPQPRDPQRKNWRGEWDAPTDFAALAATAVRTLREVFATGVPGDLRYHRFHRDGRPLPDDGLGLGASPDLQAALARSVAAGPERMRELARVLRRLKDVEVADDQGDDGELLALRFDGALVYARVLQDGRPRTRFYAGLPALGRVTASAYELVNNLNTRLTAGRVVLVDDMFFVALEVFGAPPSQQDCEWALEGVRSVMGSLEADIDAVRAQNAGLVN